MEKQPIKLRLVSRSSGNGKVDEFIKHLYDTFPRNPMDGNQFAMLFGSGDDQSIAVFDIRPSKTRPNTAVVHWVHTYPHRQGVGTRAFGELKAIASGYGVGLELYPWKHGPVSQSSLMRFYRRQGFKPINKGGKEMAWSPVDEASRISYVRDYDPNDEFYDPDERTLSKSAPRVWDRPEKDDTPPQHQGKMEYVPGYDSYFYTSGHIQDRDDDPDRHVRGESLMKVIAGILHRNMDAIRALPRKTKFVLRTPYRRSVVIYKTDGPRGKDLYVLLTVLPPGEKIPHKIRNVFSGAQG